MSTETVAVHAPRALAVREHYLLTYHSHLLQHTLFQAESFLLFALSCDNFASFFASSKSTLKLQRGGHESLYGYKSLAQASHYGVVWNCKIFTRGAINQALHVHIHAKHDKVLLLG